MRKVANKSKSRKVHSAVFFRGRQERPKYQSLSRLTSTENAYFLVKTRVFHPPNPRLTTGKTSVVPEDSAGSISTLDSGDIDQPKPASFNAGASKSTRRLAAPTRTRHFRQCT